jgi:transglutaminase-like putative cysteine protease/tetratricopeptide (TPR) repeat protein
VRRRLLLALAFVLAFTPPPDAAAAAKEPALWEPGIRDPGRGLVGRWERELARREGLLRGRKGPEAVVGLLGLVVELGGEIADTRLDGLLRGVGEDRRQDPLVRSYAGYLRGELAEARGDRAAARRFYEAEGYVLGWQIVGPFDNSGGAGHDAIFAPETTPFDGGQSFTGTLPGEALLWQQVDYDQAPRRGYVALDDRLSPSEHATGYATVWIRAARPTAAALHLGTSGPYRVWLDDEEIGDGGAYRAAHPLQETHGLALAPGVHRLLVKVSAEEGGWGLFARLSAPEGGSLVGVDVSSMPLAEGAKGVAKGASAARAVTARSLRQALVARASGPRATGAALLDLVELERWTHPYRSGDRTAVEHARTADAALRSSRSAWLLALADPDPTSSQAAMLRGIERARAEGAAGRPLLAHLLVELGWRERALGLNERFRGRIAEARALAPDDAEIEAIAAAALAESGFPLVSLAWMEDLVRRYPESTLLRGELVERLLALGRTEEGLAALTRLRGGYERSGGVDRQIAEGLLTLGRLDEAVAIAKERAAAAPGLTQARRDLARLLEARGDLGGAQAELLAATKLAPQDADLHAALGRIYGRAGDQGAAVRSLRRSLELRPQQPDLRDLLVTLEPQRADDLFSRYAVDLQEIAARPTPKAWKGKEAATLHRRIAVRVLPNGLSERLDHRIIRILDDRGIRSQAVQAVVYDPDESYVDVRRARVRRADGTIVELGAPRVVSLSQAGYRMYYDQRQQLVEFAGLRVGDVIEVAFVRRDVAARNMFDDYFGDLVAIDAVEPQARVEVIYEAPASRPLRFNRPVKESRGSDGTVTYRYVARDLPGIRPEANMPGWTEIARYLHVSTYDSWDAVGRWYWGLVREQLVVDAKIRAGVQGAIAGLGPAASEREKVAAIYRHVIESTRYVGLEFGIHGYKPYRTTDVYDRRFGDCKDKASLLKVMLAEVGIKAHLVLVRTRDQGAIGAAPASLAAFNHAIVYVPSLELYLDGTAEHAGVNELPYQDQGASALIVREGEGASLTTIPASTALDNLQVTTQTVRLAADGAATIEHSMRLRGAGAATWRANLQAVERQRERLTQLWGRVYPGVVVESPATPTIGDLQAPIEVSARLLVPGLAQRDGESLRLPALTYRPGLARALAPQARREHPLILTSPAREEHTIEVILPPGHVFAATPQSRSIEGPALLFKLEVAAAGERATIRSALEYKVPRIEAADYRAFRDLLSEVDAALEQNFEIRRAR